MIPLQLPESSSPALTAGRTGSLFGEVKVLTAPLSGCQTDFMSKEAACPPSAPSSFAVSATKLIRLER
jgi:hypothetical protein